MVSFPDFEKSHILVIGDLILDRYWSGDAERISPEAPVPIVHIHNSQVLKAGGAANVALNVAALSSPCTIMGIIGQDENGKQLKNALIESSVNTQLLTIKHHPTTTKIRNLSQHQQLIRLDFEHSLNSNASDDLINNACQYLHRNPVDLVICSDYAKGALTNIDKLIKVANEKKIPILVDPKSKDFSVYQNATILTPNLKEFQAALGMCPNEATLVTKARYAIEQYGFQALLITRGAEGMSLILKDKPAFHLPAHTQEIFDVTGAGDTVTGVLGACIAAGATIENSIKLANLAASIVVKKVGAAAVTIHELRRAFQCENNAYIGILTQSQLKQVVMDAKAHGETLVMTNGCFDILHAGHVEYLEEAKKLGDYLIVAVNDDQSVARLKGESRPIKTLEERMEILASLRAVDWVVAFSEDTPERLISEILPDILVKGGDYKKMGDAIAGGKAVKKNGGVVKILNFKTGDSTTKLIKKIQGKT